MKIKIYSYGDGPTEWLASEDLDGAVEIIVDMTRETEAEVKAGMKEVSDKELLELNIYSEDGKRTGNFKEALDKLIIKGEIFPTHFACSEF